MGCILFQNLTNLDRSERKVPRSQSNLICSDTSEKIWLSHAHLCCGGGSGVACLLVKEGVVCSALCRREPDDHAHCDPKDLRALFNGLDRSRLTHQILKKNATMISDYDSDGLSHLRWNGKLTVSHTLIMRGVAWIRHNWNICSSTGQSAGAIDQTHNHGIYYTLAIIGDKIYGRFVIVSLPCYLPTTTNTAAHTYGSFQSINQSKAIV